MKKFTRYQFLKTNRPLYLLVKPKVELVVEPIEQEVKSSKHKRKRLKESQCQSSS